jgi:hypothetical protein
MRISILALILLLSTRAALAGGPPAVACPSDMSGDSIEDWRDNAVKAIIAGNNSGVSASLNTCFPSQKPSCLSDLAYYNQQQAAAASGAGGQYSSGYGSDPNEYKTLTSENDLPPEFLSKDESGSVIPGSVKIPEGILELAKSKGWKAANYKTRSSGGFDNIGNLTNLTIVAVPGATKDIFLQISPPPDGGDPNNPNPVGNPAHGQNTLTVITVDKTKTPPLGQLRLMNADGRGGYQWNNNLRSEDCTTCHASPLRSISPRGYLTANDNEQRMTPEQERNISEINNMMVVPELKWGSQMVGGREIRRGPRMDSQPTGWAPQNSETRKEAFITQCAQNASSIYYSGFGYSYNAQPTGPAGARNINWQKVATAMNCVDCHNGKVRGFLHEGFSQPEIHFKLLVDRSMPFASDNLNMDERLAVVNCLRQERSVVRDRWRQSGSWMKSQFCEDFNGGSGSGSAPAATTR